VAAQREDERNDLHAAQAGRTSDGCTVYKGPQPLSRAAASTRQTYNNRGPEARVSNQAGSVHMHPALQP
jgi:hypothetical protein